MGFINKIFGTHSQHELKRIKPIVDKILGMREQWVALSDEELQHKTVEFKERLAKGETLDDILPEAFATVREASRRVLGEEHYPVQLTGGIVLHQGRIAEMRTGEGKTLVSTLPAYLNALEEKGVHIVTVNDYLATRDAEWMGKVHNFLGLTVGVVTNDMENDERREAYNCDITYITNNELGFASAAHIEFHARIVVQKYIQRELIRVCTDIQNKAYDEATDVADLVDMAQKQVFEIAEGNIKKETTAINALIDEAIKGIEIAGKRADGLSGVPSGFNALDEVTSGWQPSDLVIIAARPSMGKTAFVLSMTRNMAVNHNQPIALFSLEMSSVQLVNRLIASETELGSEKIRNGKLSEEEWQQLHSKIKALIKAPIYVDDTPALSIFELRAKCRRLQQRYGIKVLIIDYLQLMTAGADMRGTEQSCCKCNLRACYYSN